MKYTYNVEAQGINKDSIYLKFSFDRIIHRGRAYYGWDNAPEVVFAVNNVLGVIPCSDSGLILADGNKLTAKIAVVEAKEIPKIASRIVKRVQRRFAKGESRQRVKRKKLLADIDRLNKLIH